jgi:hypothetical protein
VGGSPYLEDKVERARDLVELHTRSGLAYFEWSADPDADPDDEDEWSRCMPALGHTITLDAIRAELRAMADNLPDFRRAYLNQWVPKHDPDAAVIDPTVWAALADPNSSAVGRVVFAAEIPPDRSTAAIVAVGRRSDGHAHVEVIEPSGDRSGTWWLAGRLAELSKRHKPLGVVVDAAGPGAEIVDALRPHKVTVTALTTREVGRACGAFKETVEAGRLRHQGDPRLSSAIETATRRNVGDLWTWQRRGSGVEVSTLIGATLGLYALDALPARSKSRSGVVV